MNRIDRYILRFTKDVDHSNTTESRYYNVNNHTLRVSDHIILSRKTAEWSIVTDSINPDKYILYDPETYHLSVMDYEEAKTFVKGWVMMSKTACRKTKANNDSLDIVSSVMSLVDRINNKERKASSLNDIIDLTKLTMPQLKQVQKMILDNELNARKIRDTINETPSILSLDSFTKGQQKTIRGFITQNSGIKTKE